MVRNEPRITAKKRPERNRPALFREENRLEKRAPPRLVLGILLVLGTDRHMPDDEN